MAKLYIAKNRYGGYYVKVKNKYLKCEKIVAANLPEGVELAKDYGWFDCDYFLSCFKKSIFLVKASNLAFSVCSAVIGFFIFIPFIETF